MVNKTDRTITIGIQARRWFGYGCEQGTESCTAGQTSGKELRPNNRRARREEPEKGGGAPEETPDTPIDSRLTGKTEQNTMDTVQGDGPQRSSQTYRRKGATA